MFARLIAAVLILCSASCAHATVEPATRPATQAATLAATQPATQPTTKFPTPAELVAKLKQMQEEKAERAKVAYIHLAKPVTEKPVGFSWFGIDRVSTLYEVVDRLHQARDDQDVRAVLMTLGSELQVSFAQAQEIRDALLELRKVNKATFVYADSYDTVAYTIASGATNICLMEGGDILIPGVGFEAMFYKGTLDKVGVEADYVQIGEYKGAEEPFTRTGPSEQLHSELNRLAESMFEQIVAGICRSRNLSTQSVQRLIDDTMLTAAAAKERGFVDHLVSLHDLRKLIAEELDDEIELVHDYGESTEPEVDFSNPFTLLAALGRKPEVSDRPQIGLVYADGVIVDGEGAESLFGDAAVGSDSMRRTLRTAARDEHIKAIVLRIDSPGGSSTASEAIWQALRQISDEYKKPVIVSVGSMAASGGYYLASAGDYIFADRCSIVGSIGVVGGKFVLKDLYEKLGLSTTAFSQGRNAELFSSSHKFDDRQRQMIRAWMQQTYDLFTQRIMTTRKDKIADIDKVARGRIFIAEHAKELGMVDELGGCEDAIAYAAEKVGLESGEYDVRQLPQPKTLADYLTGRDEDARLPIQPAISVSPNSVLLALPPAARRLLGQQVLMMQVMQRRGVALMSPYIIAIK